MEKIYDLKDLKKIKDQLKKVDIENVQFSETELNSIALYCCTMGYMMDLVKDDTIKVFNPHNNRYGIIKKIKRNYLYGYMKDNVFISKYSLKDNFIAFKTLLQIGYRIEKRRMLALLCGIIDLEYSTLKY